MTDDAEWYAEIREHRKKEHEEWREWWTGEEYWEEGVSAGGDEGLNVPIMPKENITPVYNSSIPLNHAY